MHRCPAQVRQDLGDSLRAAEPEVLGPAVPTLRPATRVLSSETMPSLPCRLALAPPNKPLKQSAAPCLPNQRLPLARGEVPRARPSPPDAFRFPDAAAA